MSAPICYFDTSALVKLYVLEAGSSEIAALFGSSERCACHEIAYVETRAALASALRGGRLDSVAHAACVSRFVSDWQTSISYVRTDPDLLLRAAELAEGFALRGYDAMHLASADRLLTVLPATLFVSFDQVLNRAAKLLGFTLPPFVPIA
ncbi:MAG: type II toxin-antitoxin system VapC family toxin [Pseudomonadota bacterium]|nr:type II toxin-antitoxin system VapC family toxin [Pseudomonadota bacterium]MDP1905965.1 type II toxin-antitoxin system VapC family toxin [Pseudomonadota bacterium]MDP2351883.1 type II toxin-antitoxin system VapC family toxin [Pseudomonadota bacterium]